jgi:hypothetical protein
MARVAIGLKLGISSRKRSRPLGKSAGHGRFFMRPYLLTRTGPRRGRAAHVQQLPGRVGR